MTDRHYRVGLHSVRPVAATDAVFPVSDSDSWVSFW